MGKGGRVVEVYFLLERHLNTLQLNFVIFHNRSPLSATAKDEDEFGHMSPQAEEVCNQHRRCNTS